MDDIKIQVAVPLDSDGFLRRECPTCKQEFKWYAHEEGDPDAEAVDQYFCPLCGVPSGVNNWWTPAQIDFTQRSAGPALDQAIQEVVTDELKGTKGVSYKPNRNFSLEAPTPEPLVEPDDMLIVEPPCHQNEPVKVPEPVIGCLHCLICGSRFGV